LDPIDFYCKVFTELRAGPSETPSRHFKWRGGAKSVLATPSETTKFLAATPGGGGSDQPCVGRKKGDKRKEGILFPAANVPLPLIILYHPHKKT